MSLINDQPAFYQSYLDAINNKADPKTLDQDIKGNLKDTGFRRHLQSRIMDARCIKELAPYMVDMIIKPQELIYDREDHYLALDQMTNTYYLCYGNLCMIDIDLYKNADNQAKVEDMLPHCQCQIEQVIENWISPEQIEDSQVFKPTWSNYACRHHGNCPNLYRYRVYKSRQGYHVFLISHSMNWKDDIALQLMCESVSDTFYTIFTHLRGWCVRVNRKADETQLKYPYYGDVVAGQVIEANQSGSVVNPWLVKLINLHLEVIPVFEDSGPVLSFRS